MRNRCSSSPNASPWRSNAWLLARPAASDLRRCDAFVWQAAGETLQPVRKVNSVALELLKAIDRVRDILIENTERFASGLPANNALLWGARGMGKSSLVKATHAEVAKKASGKLKLVEIHREDIEGLPTLMTLIRRHGGYRFIVFCDDLSFDADDTSFKSLKAALEGGIEGRPDNMLFYATSNRRHLLARDMMENERSTAINPHEAVQEKVSLSDRFGLWLGFHNCSQDEYLAMVDGYARHFKLAIEAGRIACGGHSNGRSPAAAVPAAWPGSSFRICPAGSASGPSEPRTYLGERPFVGEPFLGIAADRHHHPLSIGGTGLQIQEPALEIGKRRARPVELIEPP